MNRAIAFLVVVLCFATPSGAADPPAESHEQAAAELLEVMDLESSMMSGASAFARAMSQQNPSLAPYQDVILEWAKRHLTWEEFGPRYVEIFTEAFTEAELREVTAFYKTPTGSKSLRLMPQLMQRGMAIGMEVAEQHMGELEQMIQQRQTELDQGSGESQ